MKFISSSKMNYIDRKATRKFGIPSLILMENAGRSAADEVEKMLGFKTSKIAIFCGRGNNGGDGFVVARHLINRSYAVTVYLVGGRKKMKDDTRINFEILRKMKSRIVRISNLEQARAINKNIKRAKLLVDAIFGIGMKGRLNRFYSQLIEQLNGSPTPILSLDIPSGLDADEGTVLSVAIRAKRTVTMGLAKKGFLNPVAKRYLGRVVVADISLPNQLKR